METLLGYAQDLLCAVCFLALGLLLAEEEGADVAPTTARPTDSSRPISLLLALSLYPRYAH